MKNRTLIPLLNRLVSYYNDYSILVQFNWEQMIENNYDKIDPHKYKAHMFHMERYMEQLADFMGVKIEYEYRFRIYLSDDLERYLEYKKASVVEEKGYWFDVGSLSCRCSVCGCKNNKESKFCPECGAYMKGEREC